MISHLLLGMSLAGCSSTYYRINAQGSSQAFYTTKYDKMDQGKVIRFNDLKSGALVTMDSPEIQQISKDELPPGVLK